MLRQPVTETEVSATQVELRGPTNMIPWTLQRVQESLKAQVFWQATSWLTGARRIDYPAPQSLYVSLIIMNPSCPSAANAISATNYQTTPYDHLELSDSLAVKRGFFRPTRGALGH